MPHQPLETLAGSLSAADLHLVVMGDPFVGLVHPCKIYNILAVGSPCLYVGPQPSHVSELAASLPPLIVRCASHGDVAAVAAHVRTARAFGPPRSGSSVDADRQVARMISLIELAGQRGGERIPAEAILS
jgi:hypothetical protein